jgi:hypothetical protein
LRVIDAAKVKSDDVVLEMTADASHTFKANTKEVDDIIISKSDDLHWK